MLNAKHCDKLTPNSFNMTFWRFWTILVIAKLKEKSRFIIIYISLYALDANMTPAKILPKKYLAYLGAAPTF